MSFMYGLWFGLVLSTLTVTICVYLSWRAFRHSQGLDRRGSRPGFDERALFGSGWTPDEDQDDADSVPWESGSGGGWAVDGGSDSQEDEAWVRDPDYWKKGG